LNVPMCKHPHHWVAKGGCLVGEWVEVSIQTVVVALGTLHLVADGTELQVNEVSPIIYCNYITLLYFIYRRRLRDKMLEIDYPTLTQRLHSG
jgi:hypothetical protein